MVDAEWRDQQRYEVQGATQPIVATGILLFNDVDLSDSHQLLVNSFAADTVLTNLPDTATILSWLTSSLETDSSGATVGSLRWTFSAPESNFDGLADGDVATITYHVALSDEAGANVTRDITVVISGIGDHGVLIDGTSDDDSLDGNGAANNIIVGHHGNDSIHAGDGSDTYIYAPGDGNDTINDESSSSTSTDKLRLTNLNPGDVSFSRSGDDAYIRINATGE